MNSSSLLTKATGLSICLFLTWLLGPVRVQAAIPTSERQALIDLYNATQGAQWSFSINWKLPPLAPDGFAIPGTECTWWGINCDAGETMVLSVDEKANFLRGLCQRRFKTSLICSRLT